MGRGQKEVADKAAVDAMRLVLNSIDMDAVVVIGEGEKDEAPMLFNGEVVGTGKDPKVDLAVDPIDGTRPLANGFLNSIATVAIAPRDTMFNPGPFVYMDKIAVGPPGAGKIDIEAPLEDNLKIIANSEGKSLKDVTVIILQRPRHDELISRVRTIGARIRFNSRWRCGGGLDDLFTRIRYRCLTGHWRYAGGCAGGLCHSGNGR